MMTIGLDFQRLIMTWIKLMRNWEIRSRSRFCSFCQSAFEIGDVYHTTLDLKGVEPERMDYCIRCWQEKDPGPENRKGDGLAYWRGRFKRLTPASEKKDPVQKDVIRRLLDRHIRSEESTHINLCFILALMEERKKILVPCDKTVDEEGREFIVYEHKKSGDIYLIRDPHLSLKEVAEVQRQVKELIDQEKELIENEEKEKDEVNDKHS